MANTEKNYQHILKTHRRNLHKIPELDRDLPKTKEYLLSTLQQLDCEITIHCTSGICAYFDKGQNETYAFRADMDALPVYEENDCSYRSLHEGRMHACGHDGHMSMVLALGEYVDSTDDLNHNVLLIFQPAEETRGSAEEICESGILKQHNVTKIFGIHLWPFADAGKVVSRPGALMPRSSEVNIYIEGRAAHGTSPYEGIDAVYIGADYLKTIYEKHARMPGAVPHFPKHIKELPVPPESAPEDKTIIHIGKMSGGRIRNIVADQMQMTGTVRAFDDDKFQDLITLLSDTLKDMEDKYGCTTELSHSRGYPPVINNLALYEETYPLLGSLDSGYEELSEPVMISEDFAFYGHYAPALLLLLGTGTGIPLHSANFDFDESVLNHGFRLYRRILED